MLKIAVCDDDNLELTSIKGLLEQYSLQKHLGLHVDSFGNALDLMESLHTRNYDLILLDILMPGFTGIQAAREIRSFDRNTAIMFLTSTPDFAVESYRLNAFYYLLKPVDKGELFPVLDRVVRRCLKDEESVLLSMSSGLLRLPCSDIEVLEVNNKHLLFFLQDGSVREIHGTLTEYEPQLMKTGRFIKVHRSYLVNMDSIMQLSGNGLTTCSGKTVPVSRLLFNQVRKEYMDHLFRKEGDEA